MSKKIIQDHFGKTAANYANATIHALGEDLTWLVDAHPLTGNERVLDVGTGAGHAAFAMAQHVASVEGLDITQAMLEQAEQGAAKRQIDNISFFLGDVEDIPRENNSYDVVVSRWCAHHYQNVRLALAEIARVLKPNGVFLLIDAFVPNIPRADTFINALEILRDTGHVRNYRIEEWLEMCETVGLHGVVLKQWGLRLDGQNWVERMKTPPAYVDAIKALLNEADEDLINALNITSDDSEAGWGFDLPATLIKATKHDLNA